MSDRDKIIKVIARAIAADEDMPFRAYADLYRLSARAILTALDAAGLAVVPVKLTEAMLAAGNREIFNLSSDAVETWAVMLTASKETER